MKKILSLVLAMTMVFSLAACGSSKPQSEPESDPNQQIPNPIIDCETMEEASELSGIKMSVPDMIDGFEDRQIFAYADLGMIEVDYQNADETVSIRKASGDADISGDYNEYALEETVDVDQLQVTMKGADGLYNLAIWTNDGNIYAISANGGLSQEAMAELVLAVQ